MTQDEQIEKAFAEWAVNAVGIMTVSYEEIFQAGFIAGQFAPKLEEEKSCCGGCCKD